MPISGYNIISSIGINYLNTIYIYSFKIKKQKGLSPLYVSHLVSQISVLKLTVFNNHSTGTATTVTDTCCTVFTTVLFQYVNKRNDNTATA